MMLVAGKMSIFSIFLLLLSYQAVSASSLSAKLGLRVRRSQPCADGTYQHEGNACCMCASGQRLKQHCNATHGTDCELCVSGTYNSYPNHQESCVPCTSCSQPNANLEEKEPCTPHQDAKCRCKKNHYCNSDTDVCKICQPCDTCESSGVQEPCTPSKNTICKMDSGNGWIAGVVFVVLFAVAAAVTVFICWKKRRRQPSPTPEQMVPLTVSDRDIKQFVPDIAQVIGWNDMKNIATRSGITEAAIESVKLNTPQNSEEWTIQLLNIWVERKGRSALKELLENLQSCGKKNKAETIFAIVNRPPVV